ncbi:MAG: 4Fe-4S binding protein [Bacteroidales bacterium]|nr:4Fe-4S binding protein [Bacteroidales bacterium]
MSQPLISTIKDKCKLCYACVRVCPVKAIEVKASDKHVSVIPERCIGCGNCVNVCSQGAMQYRSSIAETKAILNSDNDAVAIVAPSISGEFEDITDYRKFVNMIKTLGFKYVNEVSFGVDLIALKYQQLICDYKGKYYISANCPSVVAYIEKFQPELVDNIAPIVSPMIATTKVVRKKYGDNIKVVYIGPCIQNKEEALLFDGDGKVDAVLTFKELRKLFKEFNIIESKLEYSDFDSPIGNKGSLYPISNGILQAADIDENLLTSKITTVEGGKDMITAVTAFHNKIATIRQNYNMFFCNGCLMGRGMSTTGNKFIKRSVVVKYAKKRLTKIDVNNWKEQINNYINLDFSRTFKANDQRIKMPSKKEIDEVLKIIGLNSKEKTLSCGSCGYDSCRDFAVAVTKGLAITEMCTTATLRNSHNYINALKATNEKLAQAQQDLEASESKARQEEEVAKEASKLTSTMLHKLHAGVVIIDKELKIIQANNSFINMLGEDAKEINEVIPGLKGADVKILLPFNFYNLFSYVLTNNEDILNRDVQFEENIFNASIFTIKTHKIVGVIVRDMSSPEIRKEEVVNRVTDVIDKNLELVQKIGFLLGEGASETEQMLNSIIEFYKSQKDKKK